MIIVIEVPFADRKVRPSAEVKGMLRDAPEDTPDIKMIASEFNGSKSMNDVIMYGKKQD